MVRQVVVMVMVKVNLQEMNVSLWNVPKSEGNLTCVCGLWVEGVVKTKWVNRLFILKDLTGSCVFNTADGVNVTEYLLPLSLCVSLGLSHVKQQRREQQPSHRPEGSEAASSGGQRPSDKGKSNSPRLPQAVPKRSPARVTPALRRIMSVNVPRANT